MIGAREIVFVLPCCECNDVSATVGCGCGGLMRGLSWFLFWCLLFSIARALIDMGLTS